MCSATRSLKALIMSLILSSPFVAACATLVVLFSSSFPAQRKMGASGEGTPGKSFVSGFSTRRSLMPGNKRRNERGRKRHSWQGSLASQGSNGLLAIRQHSFASPSSGSVHTGSLRCQLGTSNVRLIRRLASGPRPGSTIANVALCGYQHTPAMFVGFSLHAGRSSFVKIIARRTVETFKTILYINYYIRKRCRERPPER